MKLSISTLASEINNFMKIASYSNLLKYLALLIKLLIEPIVSLMTQ